MQKIFIISFLVIAISTIAIPQANAQVRSGDISLTTAPQFPKPNQNVTATLNSYVVDLDKTYITWTANGREVLSGVGKKTFSFSSGSSTISINVKIDTTAGQSVEKSLTITPSDIDMLWEAYDTYVPPFYKGKALVSGEGSFKVVALPNLTIQNAKANPKNLSYTWKKDSKGQPSSSGWGKNYFIFTQSFLDRNNKVDVEVSDVTGGTSASASLVVSINNPKILFYESTPDRGILYEKTVLEGFTVKPDGVTIVAEPYFFSSNEAGLNNLSFSWFINGNQIETPLAKNTLSVSPPSGESGSARIKTLISNTKTLFQSAEKETNVSF